MKALKRKSASIPNSRWLAYATAGAAFCFFISTNAHAQLYIGSGAVPGVVGEYNPKTGRTINANFITGLEYPSGLAVSGNTLLVAEELKDRMGAYDATTGEEINANFITGVDRPTDLAMSGNNLYVLYSYGSTVGLYDATTGATINAAFIGGGPANLSALVILGKKLYVADPIHETVSVYSAVTGTLISKDFIQSLNAPVALAISGNRTLLVANADTDSVGEFASPNNGSLINANFITGATSPLARLNNYLYMVNSSNRWANTMPVRGRPSTVIWSRCHLVSEVSPCVSLIRMRHD